MKNRLLALIEKLLPKKGINISRDNSHINNHLSEIKRSRFSRVGYFLASLIAGLIAFTIIALYMTPSGAPASSYKTSWIGNTFGGGDKWVQIQISGMYVAPDGTVYANSIWDEGGREAGIYKNGDIVGKAKELHGWGRLGGLAVTANRKYLYVGMKQEPQNVPLQEYPPEGTNWYCVRRYLLSGEPAPFTGGRGYDRSMLIVNTSSQVTGLATAGNELYVSDPAANRIRVYDPEKMTELRSWSFARPAQITVDRSGNLWIIQAKDDSTPAKILHYSRTGKQLPEQITDVVEPTAIAVDNQGRLLVTENGPRQQVLIYNITGKPKLVNTFGTEGGIYSGKRGEIGDLKFYGLAGVGSDAAGNIYVSNDGFNRTGVDLRKLSSKGKLQWQLLGLQFVDCADADPATDVVDVFTKDEHFVMDYSKGTGREWTYKGYTLDKFRYPDDPRLGFDTSKHQLASVFVRRIAGKRFLYVTGMWADFLSIYRMEGEIAVPSAMFAKKHLGWPSNQPEKSRWLWFDKNGDGSFQSNEFERLGDEDDNLWGWEIDSKGDIWQASRSGVIRHYRFSGLDDHGSPLYSRAASEEIRMPKPFEKLERIKYFPETDVMYLAGYTDERPQTGEEWGIIGTEIVRYDNWSKTKDVRWRLPLPYNPADDQLLIKSMDVAGDGVFAVTSRTAEVYVYDAKTGNEITKLAPGSEVGHESGLIDIPYGLRAHQRKNGEYLVFVEEDWKGKTIMYRLAAKRSR